MPEELLNSGHVIQVVSEDNREANCVLCGRRLRASAIWMLLRPKEGGPFMAYCRRCAESFRLVVEMAHMLTEMNDT